MKKIFAILLMFFVSNVYGQNWEEWTQQKKTQIKYLTDQIAALQMYAGYVEKGYAIAKNGLDVIHNIKKGDFFIHKNYFNSLKNVNPKIKSYWEVADIIALQIKIVKSCHRQMKLIHESGQFTAGETSYCNKVFTNLLEDCSATIDQLIELVTGGMIQMKDDERIKRIDGLHADIQDRDEFVQHFSNETNILALQRSMDVNDIQTSKALMNIRE